MATTGATEGIETAAEITETRETDAIDEDIAMETRTTRAGTNRRATSTVVNENLARDTIGNTATGTPDSVMAHGSVKTDRAKMARTADETEYAVTAGVRAGAAAGQEATTGVAIGATAQAAGVDDGITIASGDRVVGVTEATGVTVNEAGEATRTATTKTVLHGAALRQAVDRRRCERSY